MLGVDLDKECKPIAVHLHIEEHDDIVMEETTNENDWLLGYTGVSSKTRWESLDEGIKKLFNEYVHQIDTTSHLGLDDDCIWYYRVGEVVRTLVADDSASLPELLPCGYLVGNCNYVRVFIKTSKKFFLPVSLALDTLIPLPILNR